MTVRVVSAHIVHAWLPSGFCIISASANPNERIAAAARCALQSGNYVWLSSGTAFLRRVVLQNPGGIVPVELGQHFLSNAHQGDTFPLSDLALSLDIGNLYSINVCFPQPGKDRSVSSCACFMEVFGTEGFVCVGVHDGVVKKSFRWRRASDIASFSHTIETRSFQDAATIPQAFVSPATVVITAGGAIRVASGESYLGVCRRLSWLEGSCNQVNISQTPIMKFSDAGNRFLVVLGCFRAGVILYPGEREKVKARRFILKGGPRKLDRYAVRVRIQEHYKIELEEIATKCRTCVSYSPDAGTVNINFSSPLPSKFVKSSKYAVAMQRLLQGIESLGEKERNFSCYAQLATDSVGAYNSAILFAAEWKSLSVSRRSKHVSGRFSPVKIRYMAKHADIFSYEQRASEGKEIAMMVSIMNETHVTLGKGWSVRMCILKTFGMTEFSGAAGEPLLKSRAESENSVHRDTRIVRVLSRPLPCVQSLNSAEVMFPVFLDSHAPLEVSLSLYFEHQSTGSKGGNTVDVEVSLIERQIVDVLQLSQTTLKNRAEDRSHAVLTSALLRGMPCDSSEDNRLYSSSVSRFGVPLSSQKIHEALELDDSLVHFKTVLGAQYSISLACELREGLDKNENACSTISVKGAQHVIPFVRSAILRKLMMYDPFEQRRVHLGGYLLSPERSCDFVFPEGNDYLACFREAESELSRALRSFESGSRLDPLSLSMHSKDRESLRRTTMKSTASYSVWRRQIEESWRHCCHPPD